MANDSSRSGGGDALNKMQKRLTAGFNRWKGGGATPDQAARGAFFYAVRNNRVDAVRKLLDGGFDPDAYDGSGKTALHVAATNNAADVARLLIERGANPRLGREDEPERTPLEDAVAFNQLDMVELLARHGGYAPGKTVHGWSLLLRACERGKREAVEILIRAGADCNERTENGSTPLLIAVSRGYEDLAAALLKFPAVVESMNGCFVLTDRQERTAFHLAVEGGYEALARSMIARGAEVNKPDATGRTPLLAAIENGDMPMVRLLAESGADLNAPCGSESTALIYVCKTGEVFDETERAEMIDLLITLGADAGITSADGKQPLHHLLSEWKSPEALLRWPVEKETRDASGMTPLLYAVGCFKADYARLLLRSGADPDGRHGKDARTPLIEAVRHGNLACVEALLQAGANPWLLDSNGRSALFYARDDAQEEIVEMLERALAQKPGGKFPYPPPGCGA